MAYLHGGCSDFTDGSSDEEGSATMAAKPALLTTQAPTHTKAPTPVTMEAIGELMAAHHKKIAADMALIREDIKGITVRLGAVEASSADHTTQIADLQAAVRALQQKSWQYRWGPSRTIHIDKGDSKHVVHDMQEAIGTLGLFNLPKDSQTLTPHPVDRTSTLGGNAANVPEFIPRRRPLDPYAKATT
ncbi:Hypothetical predicted protein [Pelobates cultripes]|uniref:Uncharacterized protein n=1 Tax=Pelobates cultripes TaxID=61616 RepID=A0AAD1TEU2_PELCU|nr:Hypothetical predicted protein [Pelobates cultripes]